MKSDALKKAQNKYRKEKTYRVLLELYPPDQDLIDKIKSVENKQGYIKQLIRDDIKNKE